MKEALTIAILLALFPANAEAKFSINPTDTVKEIIRKFREEASALIAQAGNETRASMTHAFQLSEVIIGVVEKSATNLLEKTFQELDGQQQKAFQDANALLDRITPGIDKRADELGDIARQSAQLGKDIFIWAKKPIITSYKPEFVVFNNNPSAGNITVEVNGLSLNAVSKKAELKFGGETIFASDGEALDTRLRFSIPRRLVQFDDSSPNTLRASLTIFYDDSWVRLPWSDYDSVSYSLQFTALPKRLGSYTYTAISEREELEPISLPSISLRAEVNSGSKTERGCVRAPRGTIIDRDKTAFIESSKRVYGGHSGDHDNRVVGNIINTGSFTVEYKNDAEACFAVTAINGFASQGKSITSVEIAAFVLKPKIVQNIETFGPLPLEWKDPPPLPFKRDAKSQILSLELFNDLPRIVGVRNRNSDSRFLTIDPDSANNMLFLRPARFD